MVWRYCIHDVYSVWWVAPVAPLMTQSSDGVAASMMYMGCHELLLWHPWWRKALMGLLHPWCTWGATSCSCGTLDDAKLWWGCCIHDVHGVPRVAPVAPLMTQSSDGVAASMMYMVCHELLLWQPWWHKALMELLHPWCTWCATKWWHKALMELLHPWCTWRATNCCCDSRDDKAYRELFLHPRCTKLSKDCCCHVHDVRSLARTVVVVMSTMYEA